MPAYDVAPWIAEAVRSVLNQTWPDLELIVVDDGSTDGTGALLDALAVEWSGRGRRIELIHRGNAGSAASRNAALDRVTGEVVAFADADDVWHPELLHRLVGLLRSDSRLAMAFPRCRYVDVDGNPLGQVSPGGRSRYAAADLIVANPIHTGSGVVASRRAVEAAGRFDTGLSSYIDLDFWVRVAGRQPAVIGCVDAVLVDYRRRPGQITGDWRRMRDNRHRLLGKLPRLDITLGRRQRRVMRAREHLYWATLAYKSGALAEARRLLGLAWIAHPGILACDANGRIRTLACAATLLPRPLHDLLRRWYKQGRYRDMS